MNSDFLSNGWRLRTLKEVCKELFAGGDVPKDKLSKFIDIHHKVPIYTNGEKNNGLYGYTDKARVKEPSITISARGTIGYSAIRTEPFFPAIRLITAIPNLDLINLKYLFYSIQNINFIQSGASIPQLTVPMLKDYKISLPSLSTQQKIVAKLDAIFAEIDVATAAAEANAKNAEALFQSYLKEDFERMITLYGKKPIEYFCEDIFAGGDVPENDFSKTKTKEFSVPVIANAVKDNGLYGYTNKPRVTKPSLTIAGRGSGTGHTEIRTEPFFPIVRLIVLTPNPNLIKLNFLNYSVLSLKILSSGSAIPQLTIPMIKGYFIPNAPLSQQDKLIMKIDTVYSEFIKLKSIEKRKIKELDFLKRSILQKAFSGELVKD